MYNGIGHAMYISHPTEVGRGFLMALNYNLLKVSDKRVILFQFWSNLEGVNY